MEGSSTFLLALPLLALPIILRFFFRGKNSGKRPCSSVAIQQARPPSPCSMPWIGHVHLVPHLSSPSFIPSLHQKLGPIFTLRLGRLHGVFVASADLTREALLEKGALFSARPQPMFGLLSSHFHTIISSNATFWRSMRRNLLRGMLSPTKISAANSESRQKVLHRMISRFGQYAHTSCSEPVLGAPIYAICRLAMIELLLFMCLGYSPDDYTISQVSSILQEILPLLRNTLSDSFPLLRVLDAPLTRRGAIRRPLIERHQMLAEAGELAQVNYLSTLLAMQNEDPSIALSMDNLVGLCIELLVAGVDTTVTSVEWTMAHLVKDPLIQAKLHSEIRNVVGGDEDARLVRETDLPKLTYLRAVVTESLRLHPPAQSTFPYVVSQPCKLGGYDITPNMVLLFSLTAISRDPKLWDEPLEFRPERMLSTNVDTTGTKQMTMIPFGAGRRICPGLGLGTIHVQLFIARMVQAYEWRSSEPDGVVDLSERFEILWVMRNPLKAVVRDRTGDDQGEDVAACI